MSGKAAIFYTGSWFTQNLTDPSQNPAGEDGIGFFNIPVVDESAQLRNFLLYELWKYPGTG